MSTSTTKGNGNPQACAACKYQRRKCAPDCILAPYFPHDSQRQFLNAHKLFGVSNITKIIKNLDPHERSEAMRTIKFQSDVRSNDPVGGCYRLVLELKRQIEYTKTELDIVLHQLAICKAQAHFPSDVQDPTSLINCDVINNVEALSLYNPMHYHYFQAVVPPQEEQFVANVDHNNENNHHFQDDHIDKWVHSGCDHTTVPYSLHISQTHINSDNPHSCEEINRVMSCERKEHNFDQHQDNVEIRFVPSTTLLMSS